MKNKLPWTIKDLIDCSPHANKVLERIKKRLKIIDFILSILAVIIILIAVIDVSIFILIFNYNIYLYF